MIQFEREDNKVKVTIQSGCINWQYYFRYQAYDEVHAELLTRQFDKHMRDKLESIRREAYEQGWKDAKGKKAKENWFSTLWPK